MLTDRSWLAAAATRKLIAALDSGGVDFRFVGGAVRDSLLGRPVTDIDLATPARPELVTQALEAAGLKAVPTGIAHGTVTAVVDGKPFEITTLRRDVETDGRHAVVAFTDDWQADAARRDFTMNALYADREGRIFDYFGGVADASLGRVRFIGDPRQRIREDALRILRFFRFHAWYGEGDPDAEGLAACAVLAALIDRLSGERVRTELLKLLRAPDPVPVWRSMLDSGIMAHVIPIATRLDDLRRLVAIETSLGQAPSSLRRLAAVIGPLLDEQVAALKLRLKLSNRDEESLRALTGPSYRAALVSHGSFRRALYGADPALVRDAALLEHSRLGQPARETLDQFICFAETWREPRFPIRGKDIVARGVAPGPSVSALLTALEAWWMSVDFRPGRKECLAELDRLMALEKS